MHSLDVGDPDVEEAAGQVGIARCLERDCRLVVGRAAAPALMMIQLLASATYAGSPERMVLPPSTSV